MKFICSLYFFSLLSFIHLRFNNSTSVRSFHLCLLLVYDSVFFLFFQIFLALFLQSFRQRMEPNDSDNGGFLVCVSCLCFIFLLLFALVNQWLEYRLDSIERCRCRCHLSKCYCSLFDWTVGGDELVADTFGLTSGFVVSAGSVTAVFWLVISKFFISFATSCVSNSNFSRLEFVVASVFSSIPSFW